MGPSSPWVYVVLALLVVCVARHYTRSEIKLPPSPPGHPILGHALKIPKSRSWETFAEWGKQYGSVIYAEALGRTMIIVNSAAAAHDLMEKKSANFSDRPKLTLLDMIGWSVLLPILPYGSAEFRKQRRLTQQYLGPSAVRSYDSIMEDRVRKFLKRLLISPDSFYQDTHGHIASIVVKAVYGHDVSEHPSDDPLIRLNERIMKETAATGDMGGTFIDFFPLFRHVPSWIPGMGLKREALRIRKLLQTAISSPFERVKLERIAGTATHSVASQLLDELDGSLDGSCEEELVMKNFAGTFYNAGTDTSRTVLQIFFLMMVFNQTVQNRAQKDIDKIIGLDRLPLLSDRPRLPYVDCIMKEVLRINPPSPLGVPHCSTQADEYLGWAIPAGSTILPNIWCMMKDEKTFPDPEKFDPDRHIIHGDGGATPEDLVSPVFGFGRRFCPGRHLAESMIWITMANVLAAFEILPCKDPITGEEIPPIVEFGREAVSSVKPFKCRIAPRKERLALITQDI